MAILEARSTVLLAAAGAAWEAGAMPALNRSSVVIGKRCVDLTDLLATAVTGVADLVVVSADLPGLDADAVRRLADLRIPVLAVSEPGSVERVRRLGVAEVLIAPSAEEIAQEVVGLLARRFLDPALVEEEVTLEPEPAEGPASGRVVAVWGPTGAPGRTSVAIGIAAARAAAGHRTVLIDADPYGGAIGQDLGVLDEVSGLLAASRAVNEGALTPDSLAQCRRRLASGLEVLTGLPRPDRWTEVRPGHLAQIIETSALHADVVIDLGFGLEEDRRQNRDRITCEALDLADEIVAVGGAEPVGLVRLARGLIDLSERGTPPGRVVINRMRDSLGWTRKDLAGMVTGYVWQADVHFVREERDTMDRALAAGKSVIEMGDSRLSTDLTAVARATLGS